MSENRQTWHYWILLIALCGAGWFVQYRENAAEIVPPRESLGALPENLGAWRKFGKDHEFDADVISVLRPSDYLLRDYYLPATNASANVYVGYYDTQRTGATYHSPRNCLPGTGWTMGDDAEVEIVLPDNRKFFVNHYIVENKGEKHIMLYWYQGRGRLTANEYTDKFLTVWDSVRRRRSDGALVRIVTPLTANPTDSERNAAQIAAHLAAALPAFVPE